MTRYYDVMNNGLLGRSRKVQDARKEIIPIGLRRMTSKDRVGYAWLALVMIIIMGFNWSYEPRVVWISAGGVILLMIAIWDSRIRKADVALIGIRAELNQHTEELLDFMKMDFEELSEMDPRDLSAIGDLALINLCQRYQALTIRGVPSIESETARQRFVHAFEVLRDFQLTKFETVKDVERSVCFY